MASLLDKVLDSKDNPGSDQILAPQDDNRHKLDDGSIVYDSTIAAVNRVFEVNPHIYKRWTAKGGFELYNNEKRINLDNEFQMLALLKGDWEPRSKYQLAWFKEKVLELAPILSYDCYFVSDGLVWDKNDAKLKRITEKDNIKVVS